jgi:hypothetical protein
MYVDGGARAEREPGRRGGGSKIRVCGSQDGGGRGRGEGKGSMAAPAPGGPHGPHPPAGPRRRRDPASAALVLACLLSAWPSLSHTPSAALPLSPVTGPAPLHAPPAPGRTDAAAKLGECAPGPGPSPAGFLGARVGEGGPKRAPPEVCGEKSCERQEETRAVDAAQWSGCRACKAGSKTTRLTRIPDREGRGGGGEGVGR